MKGKPSDIIHVRVIHRVMEYDVILALTFFCRNFLFTLDPVGEWSMNRYDSQKFGCFHYTK